MTDEVKLTPSSIFQLQDCQKQPEGKIILGSATICLGLLMLYFWVLPLLVILVDLALATLIGLLMVTYWTLRSTWSLLSSIVIMLLWRPTLLLSLFATTNMREPLAHNSLQSIPPIRRLY